MHLASEQHFPLPAPGHRDWYAYEALRAMPRLLTMVDSNPYSATYGCFDRSFWHYRTMDFPCGMNQEFALPLALASTLELPNSPYHGNQRLREIALAAVDFAAKSAHSDGTCDDYFPFERAMGALVFSLYSMTETMLVLGDRDPARVAFLAKRAKWLLQHNETGQLANHQAFAALALYNTFLVTGDDAFRKGSEKFRDLTLSWRHSEGWFQEYEGADPGYHSCLISFLGKLWQKSKDASLIEPLVAAAEFAWWFQHPDGSYAGEYGSRNTYHFYPHGFEVLASRSVHAGQIADTYLHRGMPRRTRYFNDDDRMAAHYVYDWMQAWRDYETKRPGPIDLPDTPDVKWFPDARILVVRERSYHFVCNASKGGVFKITGNDGPVTSDTGLITELADERVLVTHMVDRDESKAEFDPISNTLTISGVFQERKTQLPTPFKVMVFRALLLTIGRFNANLVRSMLQKKLITGKRRTALRFHREIECRKDEIRVEDRIENAKGFKFERLSAGTDATSIYVANSNTHQFSRLLPWHHFPNEVETLNKEGLVKITRTIEAPKVVLATARLEPAPAEQMESEDHGIFESQLDEALKRLRACSPEELYAFQSALDHFLDQGGLFTDIQMKDTGNPKCQLTIRCRTLFQMTGRHQVREALVSVFENEICPDGQGEFVIREEGPYVMLDFFALTVGGSTGTMLTGSVVVSMNSSMSDSKIPLPKSVR
jgi:hypothetical protein